MKKLLSVLTILVCFLSSVFAQEVRGIETRRVIYEGPEYSNYNHNNEYYGWELTNRNSCTVSVDISLWAQAMSDGYTTIPANIVKSQSVILKPGESYIFKREEHHSTRVTGNDSGFPISSYHLEYKAYKLQ